MLKHYQHYLVKIQCSCSNTVGIKDIGKPEVECNVCGKIHEFICTPDYPFATPIHDGTSFGFFGNNKIVAV